jgi:MFS transporter, putative metabolite:H+ symporter
MRALRTDTENAPLPAGFTPASGRYLIALFAMLMSATIFEGYDITIFHLCTPNIAKTFQLADPQIGLMATIVRVGGMFSFFVVILADRYGRKPILSVTVLCYSVFTLLTALSSGVANFTIFQSSAQVFLAAEFGVAVTMIGEEFPDESRGRALGALHMVAFLGVTAAGLAYGVMSETRWGWRGMYLLGLAPLLLIAFVRRGMRETVRFQALQAERAASGRALPEFWVSIRQCIMPLLGPYRARLLLIATMWNSIGLIGGPTVTYFSLYAKRDHGWKASEISMAFILAYMAGTAGSLLSGYLMDRIGRRFTTAAFYVVSGAAMYALFQSDSYSAMLTAEIVTMFAYQAARTATSALSTELFPTEIRATGYSLCVQVIGQIGWAISPVIIGLLSAPMGGLGNAASIFALGPLVGVVLVFTMVPETRGRTLEEISPRTTLMGHEQPD